VFGNEKNAMTGPRQLQTCSHPIYGPAITGVSQAASMFTPWYPYP